MFNFISTTLISATLLVHQLAHRIYTEITNYYNTPTNITFNYIDYQLAWSSHPNEKYYKQEYVAKDDKVEHFNNMLLIDFVLTDLPVNEIVKLQVETLNKRKKTDNVCNYNVIKNPQTGEYILDFLMSESNGNSLSIIEWNGYHYKAYTDKNGHKGVLLFGISHRAYKDDALPFLKMLSGYRVDNLRALQPFPLPDIQLDK